MAAKCWGWKLLKLLECLLRDGLSDLLKTELPLAAGICVIVGEAAG
jgi:hypothetical protein